LGDILKPIAQIIAMVSEDRMDEFGALVKSFESDRSNTLADTPEGKIIKVL
jgi:hypothetical protein